MSWQYWHDVFLGSEPPSCKSCNYLVYSMNNLTLIITKDTETFILKIRWIFSYKYNKIIYTKYIIICFWNCFISIYWHWAIPDSSSQRAVLTHIFDTHSYNCSSCCCSCPIVFLECMWFPNNLTSFQLHQYVTFQVCHLTCIIMTSRSTLCQWPLIIIFQVVITLNNL